MTTWGGGEGGRGDGRPGKGRERGGEGEEAMTFLDQSAAGGLPVLFFFFLSFSVSSSLFLPFRGELSVSSRQGVGRRVAVP